MSIILCVTYVDATPIGNRGGSKLDIELSIGTSIQKMKLPSACIKQKAKLIEIIYTMLGSH